MTKYTILYRTTEFILLNLRNVLTIRSREEIIPISFEQHNIADGVNEISTLCISMQLSYRNANTIKAKSVQ